MISSILLHHHLSRLSLLSLSVLLLIIISSISVLAQTTYDFSSYSSLQFRFPSDFLSFTNLPSDYFSSTSRNRQVTIENLKTAEFFLNETLSNAVSLRITNSIIGLLLLESSIVDNSHLRIDHCQLYFVRSTRQGCVSEASEIDPTDGGRVCEFDSWINDSTLEIDHNKFLQSESFLPEQYRPPENHFHYIDQVIYLPMNLSSSKYLLVDDGSGHQFLNPPSSSSSSSNFDDTRLLIHNNLFIDNDWTLKSNETGSIARKSIKFTIFVGESKAWCDNCPVEFTLNLGADLIMISNNTIRDRILHYDSITNAYYFNDNMGQLRIENNVVEAELGSNFKFVNSQFVYMNNTLRHLYFQQKQQLSSTGNNNNNNSERSIFSIRNNYFHVARLNYEEYYDRYSAEVLGHSSEDNYCSGVHVRIPYNLKWFGEERVVNETTGEVAGGGTHPYIFYTDEISIVNNSMFNEINDDDVTPSIPDRKKRSCGNYFNLVYFSVSPVYPGKKIQNEFYRIESLKHLEISHNTLKWSSVISQQSTGYIRVYSTIPLWNAGYFSVSNNFMQSHRKDSNNLVVVGIQAIYRFDEVRVEDNEIVSTAGPPLIYAFGFAFYTHDSSDLLRDYEVFSEKWTGFRKGKLLSFSRNTYRMANPHDHSTHVCEGSAFLGIVEFRHTEDVEMISLQHNKFDFYTIAEDMTTNRLGFVWAMQQSGLRLIFSGRRVKNVIFANNNFSHPGELQNRNSDIVWSAGEHAVVNAPIVISIIGYGTVSSAGTEPKYMQPKEFNKNEHVENFLVENNTLHTSGSLTSWNPLSLTNCISLQVMINSEHLGFYKIRNNTCRISQIPLCPHGTCIGYNFNFGANVSDWKGLEVSDNSVLFDEFIYDSFFDPQQQDIEKEYYPSRVVLFQVGVILLKRGDMQQVPGFPIHAGSKVLFNFSIDDMILRDNRLDVDISSYSYSGSSMKTATGLDKIVPVLALNLIFGGKMNFLNTLVMTKNVLNIIKDSSLPSTSSSCLASLNAVSFSVLQLSVRFESLNIPVVEKNRNHFYAKKIEISQLNLSSSSSSDVKDWCFENFISAEPPSRFPQIKFPSLPLEIVIDEELRIQDVFYENLNSKRRIVGAVRSSPTLSRFISFVGLSFDIKNKIIVQNVNMTEEGVSETNSNNNNIKFIFFETTPVDNSVALRVENLQVPNEGRYPNDIEIIDSVFDVSPSATIFPSSSNTDTTKFINMKSNNNNQQKLTISNTKLSQTSERGMIDFFSGTTTANTEIQVTNSHVKASKSSPVFNIKSDSSPTKIFITNSTVEFLEQPPSSSDSSSSSSWSLISLSPSSSSVLMNISRLRILSPAPSLPRLLAAETGGDDQLLPGDSSLGEVNCVIYNFNRLCKNSTVFNTNDDGDLNQVAVNERGTSYFHYSPCVDEIIEFEDDGEKNDGSLQEHYKYSKCNDYVKKIPTKTLTIAPPSKKSPKPISAVKQAQEAISTTSSFLQINSGSSGALAVRKRAVTRSVDSILADECGFSSADLLEPPGIDVAPLQLFFGNLEEEDESQGGYATGAVVGNFALWIGFWALFAGSYAVYWNVAGEKKAKMRKMKEKNKKIWEKFRKMNNQQQEQENSSSTVKKKQSSPTGLIKDWKSVKVPRKTFVDYCTESGSVYVVVFFGVIFIDPILYSTFAVVMLPQVSLSWKVTCSVVTGLIFFFIVFIFWRLLFKRRDCERFVRKKKSDEETSILENHQENENEDNNKKKLSLPTSNASSTQSSSLATRKNNNNSDDNKNNSKSIKGLLRQIFGIYKIFMHPEGEYEGPEEDDIGKKFYLVEEEEEEEKDDDKNNSSSKSKPNDHDDDGDAGKNTKKKLEKMNSELEKKKKNTKRPYVIVTKEDVYWFPFAECLIQDYTDRFKRFIIVELLCILLYPIACMISMFANNNCVVQGSITVVGVAAYGLCVVIYRPNEELLMRWVVPIFSVLEIFELVLTLAGSEEIAEKVEGVLLGSSIAQLVVAVLCLITLLEYVFDIFEENCFDDDDDDDKDQKDKTEERNRIRDDNKEENHRRHDHRRDERRRRHDSSGHSSPLLSPRSDRKDDEDDYDYRHHHYHNRHSASRRNPNERSVPSRSQSRRRDDEHYKNNNHYHHHSSTRERSTRRDEQRIPEKFGDDQRRSQNSQSRRGGGTRRLPNSFGDQEEELLEMKQLLSVKPSRPLAAPPHSTSPRGRRRQNNDNDNGRNHYHHHHHSHSDDRHHRNSSNNERSRSRSGTDRRRDNDSRDDHRSHHHSTSREETRNSSSSVLSPNYTSASSSSRHRNSSPSSREEHHHDRHRDRSRDTGRRRHHDYRFADI